MRPGKIILLGSFAVMVIAVNIAAKRGIDLPSGNNSEAGPSISGIWRDAFLNMFVPGYTLAKASYDTTIALKKGNIQ